MVSQEGCIGVDIGLVDSESRDPSSSPGRVVAFLGKILKILSISFQTRSSRQRNYKSGPTFIMINEVKPYLSSPFYDFWYSSLLCIPLKVRRARRIFSWGIIWKKKKKTDKRCLVFRRSWWYELVNILYFPSLESLFNKKFLCINHFHVSVIK